MSEKNKPPTHKRLREAREEGQVAQTPSIPHFLAAVGCFELIVGTSHLWLMQGAEILGSYIARMGVREPFAQFGVKDMLIPIGGVAVAVTVGMLLFAALLGLVGNLMQTGLVIATGSFLKFERMDPIQHAQQMFTFDQLGKMAMDGVKVAAIFGCAGLGVLLSMDSLLRLADGTLTQAVQTVLEMLRLCERITLVVLIFCVAIDWALQKHITQKQLLMSREDVEREQKDQFGDRHVRQQRTEFRNDMLGSQLTENTRKANAVVTNPTHYAVALLYDPSKYPLPVVLARGADQSAALMREVARKNGIPIIRSVQLARMLYRDGREWRPVPRLALKSVAAVYRVVAQIKVGERRLHDPHELESEAGRIDPRR